MPKDLFRILFRSVLASKISQAELDKAWTLTMVQDIHHSLYLTYCEVKDLSMKTMGVLVMGQHEQYMYKLINEYLRPFLLKYHTEFFENVSWEGRVTTSKPKKASHDTIQEYEKEFRVLRHRVMVEFQDEIVKAEIEGNKYRDKELSKERKKRKKD